MSEATGAEDFARVADQIERQAKPLMDMLQKRDHSGNATVQINAGGVGIQIAVLACVVQFVVFVALIFAGLYVIDGQNTQIRELKHQQDRDQDYLNAIYQQAPQLKPKVN